MALAERNDLRLPLRGVGTSVVEALLRLPRAWRAWRLAVEVVGEAIDQGLQEVEHPGQIGHVDGRARPTGASEGVARRLLTVVHRVLDRVADLFEPLDGVDVVALLQAEEGGSARPVARFFG